MSDQTTTAVATTENGNGAALAQAPQAQNGVGAEIEAAYRWAKVAHDSGVFGSQATIPKIMMMGQLCREQGLGYVQATMRYEIIEGKVSMKAGAMQAEFHKAGGEIEWVESTNEVCEANFYAPGIRGFLPIRITLEEMRARGITKGKGGEKANWANWPADMLRARVKTAGIRATMPQVLLGVQTADEIEDMATVAPEALDTTPTQATPTSSKAKLLGAAQALSGDVVEEAEPEPKTVPGELEMTDEERAEILAAERAEQAGLFEEDS